MENARFAPSASSTTCYPQDKESATPPVPTNSISILSPPSASAPKDTTISQEPVTFADKIKPTNPSDKSASKNVQLIWSTTC